MKTYKREIAVVLLIWLMYVVEVKNVDIVEVLVWPIFSFVAAAFGFDQYAKLQQASSKSTNGGRSQRSGSGPNGQGEQSGSSKPDNPD